MGTVRRQATEAEAKALASALRLRILRVCLEQPLTNREIADRLGVNPGTALHHVRKLVDTGFLTPQPVRRGRRGAREVPYLATGKSWTVNVDEHGDDSNPQATAMIDAFLQEVALLPDHREVDASRLGLRLTAQEYDELLHELTEKLDEIAARPRRPEGRPYSLFLALHPDAGRDVTPPAAS